MTKAIDMTFEEVAAMLAYDPDTGRITWKIDAARNVKAGDDAGSLKGVRTNSKSGREIWYRYISMKGIQTPAARVAWLLQTKEWPIFNILFKDGDASNLKWNNLEKGKFQSIKDTSGERVRHRMTKEAQRHYGLKRYYGLTGEQYGEMLAAQHGLCAICNKPETAMFNGQPKVMHVDHCHATNKIRALLCGTCNGMLGLAKDDPATLRAAADYIEKHAITESNVIPLKKE